VTGFFTGSPDFLSPNGVVISELLPDVVADDFELMMMRSALY
jgi:hypothetical protein